MYKISRNGDCQHYDVKHQPCSQIRYSCFNALISVVLKRYKQERLSQESLLDWIHFIWFSDLFVCEPIDADSIASVMTVLEELEEEGGVMPDDVDYCLDALNNNVIAESLFGDDL